MRRVKATLLAYWPVIAMSLAGIWTTVTVVRAVYIFFAPLPPGCLKLDAFDEIRLTSSVLNIGVPFSLACLIVGTALAIRRRYPMRPFVIVTMFTVLSLFSAVVFWSYLARIHDPSDDLWGRCVWWVKYCRIR